MRWVVDCVFILLGAPFMDEIRAFEASITGILEYKKFMRIGHAAANRTILRRSRDWHQFMFVAEMLNWIHVFLISHHFSLSIDGITKFVFWQMLLSLSLSISLSLSLSQTS